MPTTRQLWGTPREWAVRLTVAVAAGLFFGVIGPFGSYARPLPLRMVGWVGGFAFGVALFSLSIRWARLLAARMDLPLWFATGLATALACIPLSAGVGLLFNGGSWAAGGWAAWLEFYGDCLMIAAPTTAGYIFLLKHTPTPGESGPPRQPAASCPSPLTSAAPSAPAPALAPPPAPGAPARGLLDRLPPRLGRELSALQMEDHYVRAHTPLGSDLLLLAMSQAVEALDGVEGLRVHRSWWVARAAVEAPLWDGRNLRLRLKGGLEAPVARTQVAVLRAAGWLPD